MSEGVKVKKFSRTKQRKQIHNIFGFDIETADSNKSFVIASIVGKNFERIFHNPEDMINFIKRDSRFNNSLIFATNLSFDFFGTFFKSEEKSNFITIFRGSSLIMAKTYIYKGKFLNHCKTGKIQHKSLTFLDTMNYAPFSVEVLGDILGLEKLSSPAALGRFPNNDDEMMELMTYNIRDSEISYRFMDFFINAIEELGASFKPTIASTAKSLFTNKFIGDFVYYQIDKDILSEMFNAYYGGRTEAFKRGSINKDTLGTDKIFYYDVNSLYPSVMHDFEYPDPNSLHVTYTNDMSIIQNFHGISNVTIDVPYMKIPLLPYRDTDGRVLFPYGNITGWYSHVELEKAMSYGAKITKVHKSYYFDKVLTPFKDYVSFLYEKRQQFKADKSPMEIVVKLLLNSLYGKFGESFEGKDNVLHSSQITEEMLLNDEIVGRYGDYVVLKQDISPQNHCIPIWAIYVTAYARIKLHDYLMRTDPIYCDTDSVITATPLLSSSNLGDMKLEMEVTEGIIVRPKFYVLCSNIGGQKFEHIKIKGIPKKVKSAGGYDFVVTSGLGQRLTFLDFHNIMINPNIKYDKFSKFKESIRKDLIPNEVIEVDKYLSLEDTKRIWPDKFDYNILQDSEPINLDEYIREKDKAKFAKFEASQFKKLERDIILSDAFDIASVGHDISPEEFIDNEKYFYNE